MLKTHRVAQFSLSQPSDIMSVSISVRGLYSDLHTEVVLCDITTCHDMPVYCAICSFLYRLDYYILLDAIFLRGKFLLLCYTLEI